MYKSLAGLAAAAVLTVAAVPSAPANAAPIQNAPGLAEHQSGVEQVQYRYHRRYYRGYYGPRRGYYYGGTSPGLSGNPRIGVRLLGQDGVRSTAVISTS